MNERLSDVERGYARDGDGITMRGRWYSEASVERILADRLAEAEQVAETHREVAESMTGLWQSERERADQLEARLAEAEQAAEQRLAEVEAERDAYRARADVLRAKVSGGVALRGAKPGDYWAEWHRTHCAAAEAAARAEARAERVLTEVEALAGEYAANGAARDAAGKPAWPNNVARDLRALVAQQRDGDDE